MKLVVYGTLLNHPTLSHALRFLPRTRKVTLRDVEEKTIRGYPTLLLAPGKTVRGELFELSDSEVKRLDKWEERYHRVSVRLTDDSTAEAYILR